MALNMFGQDLLMPVSVSFPSVLKPHCLWKGLLISNLIWLNLLPKSTYPLTFSSFSQVDLICLRSLDMVYVLYEIIACRVHLIVALQSAVWKSAGFLSLTKPAQMFCFAWMHTQLLQTRAIWLKLLGEGKNYLENPVLASLSDVFHQTCHMLGLSCTHLCSCFHLCLIFGKAKSLD